MSWPGGACTQEKRGLLDCERVLRIILALKAAVTFVTAAHKSLILSSVIAVMRAFITT